MTVSFQGDLVCMAIGVFSVREIFDRRALSAKKKQTIDGSKHKTQAENEVSQ